MPDKKLTDNEIKKAFKVLESWLWCNYHNATDTDKERAELYKAVQTIFNAKKIPEMFTLAKAEAYKEFAERLCEGRVSNDNTVILAKCLLNELVGDVGEK